MLGYIKTSNVCVCVLQASSETDIGSERKTPETTTTGGILAKVLRNKKVVSLKPKNQPVRGCFHPGASVLSRETLPLNNGATVTGQEMIAAMLKYIWPADDKSIRDRVSLAIGLLIGAKLMNVAVPFTFKYAIDYLNVGATLNLGSAPETILTVATSLLVGCECFLFVFFFNHTVVSGMNCWKLNSQHQITIIVNPSLNPHKIVL